MSGHEVVLSIEEEHSSEGSFTSTAPGQCCSGSRATSVAPANHEKDEEEEEQMEQELNHQIKLKNIESKQGKTKQSSSDLSGGQSYATNKNVAEGLMDIALLSANANQLRFLITYNHEASTFYYSLVLVVLSLVLQLLVGIMLIFKRRLRRCRSPHYARTNELLVISVFMITVINILLAAFTTTDQSKH